MVVGLRNFDVIVLPPRWRKVIMCPMDPDKPLVSMFSFDIAISSTTHPLSKTARDKTLFYQSLFRQDDFIAITTHE